MLLIPCPYCGAERPEAEFVYAGEAGIVRPEDPATVSDEEWRDFLFMRTNAKGHHRERWRHAHGCGRFFQALRDTVSDRFLTTTRMDEPLPTLDPASRG